MGLASGLFASERGVLSLCVGALLIYLAPYLYAGTDATLAIHDNLDSNFVWYKTLLESGALFARNDFPIERINGLPRSVLPSEFDALVLLYALFGPYGAYVVNRMLITLVGFFGMYLLLRRHLAPGEPNRVIQVGGALCFALLPFWPFGGLSIAGIPLVLYAFLNIRGGLYHGHDWLILLLFPFYSNLALSGFFLLLALGLLWLWDLTRRRASAGALLALLLLSVGYLFTHYRLLLNFLVDTAFVSHRVEFAVRAHQVIDWREALQRTWALFHTGLIATRSLHRFLIFPFVLGAGLFVLCRAERRTRAIFLVIVAYFLVTLLWYGLLQWGGIAELKGAVTRVFPMQLDRFHALYPTLWILLFAIALGTLLREAKSLRLLVVGLLGLQILYQLSHHELIVHRDKPSVRAFFAEDQFRAIRDHIGRDPAEYRVASLGLHPMIAQYNGFHTLDGYYPSYPLSYKRAFRKIIAGELDKNRDLKVFFDHWGSRIYLFSNSATYAQNPAGNTSEVGHLALDYAAFRALGGRYILAAVRIDEDANPRIRFLEAFKDPTSAWDIYLYAVDEARIPW
ncbi:MAG: DUF6044 family protein [Candidatus Thiosymbion ectosymbiont of Robbea hypermnestra]|nr:DUF6044 family protein [Candidatus Thiosymbion ectosymbiont of Robbea hypermnestra]